MYKIVADDDFVICRSAHLEKYLCCQADVQSGLQPMITFLHQIVTMGIYMYLVFKTKYSKKIRSHKTYYLFQWLNRRPKFSGYEKHKTMIKEKCTNDIKNIDQNKEASNRKNSAKKTFFLFLLKLQARNLKFRKNKHLSCYFSRFFKLY